VTTRVSAYTLEAFCREAASRHPTPAGVAVAAVSAGFALGLLAKVLIVSGHRKALSGNASRLESLAAAAQAASSRMLQLADEDVAAFEAYLAATRLPSSTEEQRQERARAVESVVRRTIDVPLAAAQEAAAGLQLCSDASSLAPAALIADLGLTASLLAGALRGFLLCADSNVRQLAPEAASFRERLATETERHERAFHQAEAVLERARTALAETAAPPGRQP
jgi:methenyltetrahydrofolate cyclohydrolase